MSFRLLSLSTMYEGSLDLFYRNNPVVHSLKYHEHIQILFSKTTEFAGTYLRNFRKNGLDAEAIIANDKILQGKWCKEHGFRDLSGEQIILEQVRKYKPEVLWIENMALVSENWLNTVRSQVKGLRLISGYHCAPLNARVYGTLKGVDFLFTCTPGLKMLFEDCGKRSFLVYHGFDTDILKDREPSSTRQSGVIFSGSLTTGGNFHQARIALIEQILRSGVDLDLYANLENTLRIKAKQAFFLVNSILRIFGMSRIAEKSKLLQHSMTKISNYSGLLLSKTRPPVFGTDMYRLIRNSAVVLNYHIGIAGDWAGNMRMFEVTGLGSCLLTDNKKNMKDLFDTQNEVVVYDNADDCVSKIKWLLEHEDERIKIALAGRKRTLSSHTAEDRCRLMIDIISDELKNSG